MANIPGTNVPAITWSGGFPIIPAGPDVLAGIQSDITAAFGRTLNFNLNTPQGQISSTEAAVVDNTNQVFAFYVQQVDPAFAIGRMQDAIGRIYFLTRLPPLPTALQVACSGLGATIPVGALVKDASGNLYAAAAAGTIPPSGSVTLEFDCTVPGPTPIPIGALTIVQTIPGWDTATVSSGTLGRTIENRQAFEQRRQQTVAQNSLNTVQAIIGKLLGDSVLGVPGVPGVTDAYVTENPTGSPLTVGGATLVAHSLYVAAVGGTDLDVANAIWAKKPPGCAYNGNTTVTVTDQNSGYSPPLPTYSVTFERPAELRIFFAVNIVAGALVPSNATTLVQNAVVSAFAGQDGGQPERIGSLILASRFYSAIASLGPWAQIRSLVIGSPLAPQAQFTAGVSGTTMTVSAVSSGTIVPGTSTFLFFGAAPVGSIVLSQLGGTPGGAGTYQLSTSFTAGSQAMETILPALTQQQVQINENPTLDPADIAVTVS